MELRSKIILFFVALCLCTFTVRASFPIRATETSQKVTTNDSCLDKHQNSAIEFFNNQELNNRTLRKLTKQMVASDSLNPQKIDSPKKLKDSSSETPNLPFDGFAITSFISGILAFLFIPTGILAFIFGLIGLHRTKKRGTKGKAFAIIGLVLGSLALLVLLLILLFVFLLLMSGGGVI